jgi:3'(2'), 5'-bisphosphate nucleotidase
MPLNHDDCDLAVRLARETGRRLLRVRSGPERAEDLKALGDRTAQEFLALALAQSRPDDVVLSEEAPDPPRRIGARRVWIIDPVDGTREFAEPGRDDWAVHVALWEDGDLVCGAVALPALDEVHSSCSPPVPPPAHAGAPRVTFSRSRPPGFLPGLLEDLGAQPVPIGSAGAKCAAVWKGTVDAYVHAGGQHEWDSAAPVAVARAAGLHTSRIDGSPLRYNRPESYLPDLVVCRPELARPLLASIAEHLNGDGEKDKDGDCERNPAEGEER